MQRKGRQRSIRGISNKLATDDVDRWNYVNRVLIALYLQSPLILTLLLLIVSIIITSS
jgi:hypothetical protein